jgi:hypothetical protein
VLRGGFAHALEVREGRRVEAGGFVPSDEKLSWVRRGGGGWTYCSAEVICRGSGMSTAQACTVLAIGHQETRAGARDVLTCADGLGRLLVVFVRGQLHPGEGEVVVGQDLVQVGRCLQEDVV